LSQPTGVLVLYNRMETERTRRDNRPFNKIRPISVKLGVIESADGSAEFSLGNTRVLAAVHGPVSAKSRFEQIDRATLKITVESYDAAPSNS
jgi:exosome complex component RRP46